MTAEQPMTLRHAKAFPIFAVVCGAFILFSTLVVGFSLNTIIGLVVLAVGILMLVRPLGILSPQSLVFFRPIGGEAKTIWFEPDDIEVHKKAIVIHGKKALPLWRVGNPNSDVIGYVEGLKGA
jgi:hypothetical protein